MIIKIKKLFFRKEFSFPEEPSLPSELIDWLTINKFKYKRVIEYGSGGSTIFFANNFNSVISIESDKKFLKALQILLEKSHLSVTLLHANIGPTTRYGMPVRFLKIFMKRKYKSYSQLPFKLYPKTNADLVLVDGRFRVACTISCILNLEDEFDLIIDDFKEREEYHIILKLIKCQTREYFGRAILFKKVTPNRNLELKRMLSKYQIIEN